MQLCRPQDGTKKEHHARMDMGQCKEHQELHPCQRKLGAQEYVL